MVVDGVEADDVIATLAHRRTRAAGATVISTGDKDLTQLVSDTVLWVNTMSNETLGPEGVKRKFGVPPEQIVDYLTLVGDAVDNVPGVDKVGPKTACKLIEKYGSLEGVVAHAGEVKGVVGENLRKVLDWLPTARQLAHGEARRAAAVQGRLAQSQARSRDTAPQYERFGFKTWLRELEGSGSAAATPAAPVDVVSKVEKRKYRTILGEDELKDLLLKIAAVDLVGIDAIATSEDPLAARLVGLAFAFGDEAVYLPLGHDYAGAPAQLPVDAALALLKPWLERGDCRKVGET